MEQRKTNCTLICDTRERHVLRHEKEFENVTFEVKQMTVGDYAVMSPGGDIVAIIERKSLEDYGASLKDGRHDNKNKLTELRGQTGCRIIFIIEGPEFPSPNDYFSNIPYKYIESSIFHLVIRDGVSVLRTKDSLDTARMLARFIASMDTLDHKMELPALLSQICATPHNDCLIPMEVPSLLSGLVPPEFMTESPYSFPLLTCKRDKSDHEVAREMWSCFPGISVESADEYMKSWSIADIICGRIPRADILNFKLASGRKIGSKAAHSLTGVSRLVEVKLLAAIPGLSRAMAIDILTDTALAALLSYSIGAISIRKIGKMKRNLGEERSKKIIHYFHYKYIPPAPAEVAEVTENL